MHVYTTGQWVLLFFFYCFCGWVWESCYVSICQSRWVNRGFLNGPLLPIYGFGAIIILFATLPVEDNLYLVWLFGMLAATALEYVTGAAMEALFKGAVLGLLQAPLSAQRTHLPFQFPPPGDFSPSFWYAFSTPAHRPAAAGYSQLVRGSPGRCS